MKISLYFCMKEILIELVEIKIRKAKNKEFARKYYKPAIKVINKIYDSNYSEFDKLKILFIYFKDHEYLFDIGIAIEELLYVRKLYNED